MTEREALKLALEALEEVVKWYQVRDKNDEPLPVHNQNPEIKESIEAITSIKQALAQPEQEPVIDKSAAIRIATSLGWEPKRKPPQFPTMLRKMWSGAEVQEWINENWSER
jgi:transposase-like protein